MLRNSGVNISASFFAVVGPSSSGLQINWRNFQSSSESHRFG